jgi:hypothetical protein
MPAPGPPWTANIKPGDVDSGFLSMGRVMFPSTRTTPGTSGGTPTVIPAIGDPPAVSVDTRYFREITSWRSSPLHPDGAETVSSMHRPFFPGLVQASVSGHGLRTKVHSSLMVSLTYAMVI